MKYGIKVLDSLGTVRMEKRTEMQYNGLQSNGRERMTNMKSETMRYLWKRLVLAILTVWVVITVTFFVMRAVPGGPFLAEKAVSAEAEAALMEKYGMDRPLVQQDGTYLRGIVTRLDFGPSLKLRGRQVIDVIADGMRTSVRLGLLAAALAVSCGVVLGACAALRRGSLADRITMVLTTAFVSMPSFIMGSLLLAVFAAGLGLLPANGETARGQILPVVTLALYPMAYLTRLTRSSMLEVLGRDYIRTARAKGVSPPGILFGHALKNALIPVVTYLGPMLAYIVTGSLVVEQILAVPGIGRAFVGSITGRDYPLIMGTTIVLAVLIVGMNLVSDLLCQAVDPRIRLGAGGRK